MKKAKVSSVYEGRGRSSKSARMAAKGRRDGVRAKKALSIKPKYRTMVTRSMKVVKTMEEMHINEENLHEVEIVQANMVLDKNDYVKPIEVPVQPQEEVQKQEVVVVQPQPPVNAVAVDDQELFTSWDEWSMSMTTGDCEVGWYSCWESLTGEFWTQPFMDDRELPIWSDLWDFEDDYDQTKNP